MNTHFAVSYQTGSKGALRNWVSSRPLSSYILFTLAWSWGFWSLLFLVIEPGGRLHNPPPERVNSHSKPPCPYG